MHSLKRKELIEEVASAISASLLILTSTFLLFLGGCDDPVPVEEIKPLSVWSFRDAEFGTCSDSF